MLVNQSELESTENVVNEGKHEADDDHKLASEKILLRKACLKARSSATRPAKNEAGRFACFQHDKACK